MLLIGTSRKYCPKPTIQGSFTLISLKNVTGVRLYLNLSCVYHCTLRSGPLSAQTVHGKRMQFPQYYIEGSCEVLVS